MLKWILCSTQLDPPCVSCMGMVLSAARRSDTVVHCDSALCV